MKDNGNKINLVAKENKYLSMVPHMKVNSKMGKEPVMAPIALQTVTNTQGVSSMAKK